MGKTHEKTKKTKLDNDLDNLNLDDLDLDDLDFGDLENIDSESRNPSKAEISKELLKEAGGGFLDSVIKKTAAKALPEEYEHNYYEIKEYVDLIKDTFDVNKNRVEKSLYRLGKEVKKILPFQSKLLEKFLSKYEADFEEFKTQTEEQLRETSIASSISSIFDKQLEIQKALEIKRSAEDEVETKERIGLNKINLDILTNIDNNISNQTAFTLQISKEYYKKSLELQYKSYFIQSDMLKTMRDYYKGFSLQFDNIIKNTGLPDFVKLHTSERVTEIVRTQFLQNTYKQLFSNSEYIKNVKKKFSNLIQEKVTSITDTLDNITDAINSINQMGEFGGSGAKVLGGIFANLAGSTLGEKLAEKISPKIKEKIKDNKIINAGANYLQMLSNSPSTLFKILKDKASKKADEYADESTPERAIMSKLFSGASELLSVTSPDIKQFSVERKNILSHNQPAIFDNNVHRSITEVIPMYLAKILNENSNLRQMYYNVNIKKLKGFKEQEEKIYDYENRKLVTTDEFRASTEQSIFKNINKHSKKLKDISDNITTLAFNSLDKEKNKEEIKLLKNKGLQNEFTKYLTIAGEKISDKDFTYDYIVTNYSENKYLREIVEKNSKLKSYLEALQKANLSKNKSIDINDRMLDTKRLYPITAVKNLFEKTSIIANSITSSKTNNINLNKIDDNQANIMAKAFTLFIINNKTDIGTYDIINANCFRFIKKEDYDKIKLIISVFIGEVKKILISNDINKISSLEMLLGIVNRSLKDNFEIDPTVFQTLYDYSPLLQDSGKLTIENLAEGRIGNFKQEDFVEIEDLREFRKIKISDITPYKINIKRNDLLEKLSTKFNDVFGKASDIVNYTREKIENIKDYKDFISFSKEIATKVFEETKKRSQRLYDKTKENLDELDKFISDIKIDIKNKEAIRNKIVDKLENYIQNIEKLIQKEQNNKEIEINAFQDIINELSNNINIEQKQIIIKKIEEDKNNLIKRKDLEIGALIKIKNIIENSKNNIKNMDINNILKNAKNQFDEFTKRAKDIVDNLEEEIKKT